MAKFSKSIQAEPVIHIWDEQLTHSDGLGGGYLDTTELDASVGTGYVDKGCPLYLDYSTKKAHVVKGGTVVTGSTTTKTRITKPHLFKVGDIVAVTGKIAVAITAIDTTTSTEYDILTHLTNTTAYTAGAVLVEAKTAGASAVEKYTANCVLLNTRYIETGADAPCVFRIDQWTEKSRYTYAMSDATISALSPNIEIK